MENSNVKNTDKLIEKIITEIQNVDANEWEQYINNKFLMPRNILTKKPYKGINVMIILLCDVMKNHRSIFEYATFNQIQSRGGKLKKGSKAVPVEYSIFQYVNKETKQKISQQQFNELTKDQKQNYTLLFSKKHYSVFNVSDIANLDEINFDVQTEAEINEEEFLDNNNSENIINNLQINKGLQLQHAKVSTAFYSVTNDEVVMPEKKYFASENSYYSVLFHEIIHWTGNKGRLNRNLSQIKIEYSFEELIAEIGSILISFEMGIFDLFINSLRYLKGWLNIQKLEEQEEKLRSAFTESKKAVRYIYS